jgi:DNA-binding NtrC family response regulator
MNAPTGRRIAILILEDLSSDAELAKCALRRGGLNFVARRVDTREAFALALDEFRPDLVLSDNSRPTFRGMEALAMARMKRPDIPFILISGYMWEEAAIEALAEGVTDIVLKDDLDRLVPSVQYALGEFRTDAMPDESSFNGQGRP